MNRDDKIHFRAVHEVDKLRLLYTEALAKDPKNKKIQGLLDGLKVIDEAMNHTFTRAKYYIEAAKQWESIVGGLDKENADKDKQMEAYKKIIEELTAEVEKSRREFSV